VKEVLCVCGPVPRVELSWEQGVTDGIQSITLCCTRACACGHSHVPRVGSEVCICDELPRALALKLG